MMNESAPKSVSSQMRRKHTISQYHSLPSLERNCLVPFNLPNLQNSMYNGMKVMEWALEDLNLCFVKCLSLKM